MLKKIFFPGVVAYALASALIEDCWYSLLYRWAKLIGKDDPGARYNQWP